MYVDKKLGGVNAVQTLSRLNRIHWLKEETTVIDFANEADEIQKAFQPYYEKTLLSEATDPNLLYNLERDLEEFGVYDKADVEAFAVCYFGDKPIQDRLYALLAPCVDRYQNLPKEERGDFRKKLTGYARRYAFLSQIMTFADADLEKLYVFARLLRRYIRVEREALPKEIQQNIDMESYRLAGRFKRKVRLERGNGEATPKETTSGGTGPEEMEALSRIIQDLNERFGTDFTVEDKVFIQGLEQKLSGDPALVAAVRANPPENARLAFDHVATDRLQDMVDSNFKFYKRITDDKDFGRFFYDWLFDRFRDALKSEENVEA